MPTRKCKILGSLARDKMNKKAEIFTICTLAGWLVCNHLSHARRCNVYITHIKEQKILRGKLQF